MKFVALYKADKYTLESEMYLSLLFKRGAGFYRS